MKVYELKIQVDELFKSNSEPLKTPREIIDFVSKLVEILNPLEDEDEVHPDMMPPVKELINQFWHWVVVKLPYAQWKNGTYVTPWLSLQESLVNSGLLGSDFHHPILYEEIKNHSIRLAGNRLKITELIPLLICASRRLGYVENAEDGYPFLRLNARILAQKPQEVAKIKDIMFLLRSTFYLVYRYCTVEQLTLMPFLIYFRYPSTDEERCSELAIFNWLTQKPADCIEFFNSHDKYIDTRSITIVDALQNISDWIPIIRRDFLSATDRSRWIYPFIQQARFAQIALNISQKLRTNNPSSALRAPSPHAWGEGENEGSSLGDTRDDLIDKTFHLLELDFATQKDQSLVGVLNFTAAANRQARILTSEEARVVHSATSLLCLEKYIKNRKEDKRDKHSFLSLSGETKRHAAEKKRTAVRGKPTEFGFFETLAIKQGRLKKLVDFVDGQIPDLEDYSSYFYN